MFERGVSEFKALFTEQPLKDRFHELEQAYLKIHELGYRKMPKEMYLNWLFRIQKDSTKSPFYFETPQPFKNYNYEVQVVTGGDGQNYEFYDQDTVVRIGTVELNIISRRIERFVEYDPLDIRDEIISRMYDPAMRRWWQVDPLADKFFNMSPYVAMGNNPVRYVDPDGMEFTEAAWAWVNRLIADINQRQERNNTEIAERQSKIDAGGLSERKTNRLNRQIGRLESNNQNLEGVRGEIGTMAASDQMYNVVESSALNESGPIQGMGTNVAATSFNFETGAVDITISAGSSLGTFSHELKHGYQFETGQISLGSLTGRLGAPFLLDKHDEVAGYQRQSLFGSRQPGSSGISSLPSRYSSLPIGPVDVNTYSYQGRPLSLMNQYELNQLSKITRQAFRFNGRTYTGRR